MIRWIRSAGRNGGYAVLVLLLTGIALALFRVRVVGRGNIDRRKEYIAVARHRSYWDIPLLAVALGWWNRIHFIARKGLMKEMILLRPLLRVYSTMIDRENFGKSDFRNVVGALRRERLVAIFPEGTTREHVEAKAGAVRFAALTEKELLPVSIRARRGAYPPKYPFRFPAVTVSIGEPVAVRALEGEADRGPGRADRYRAMSDRLMERVDAA